MMKLVVGLGNPGAEFKEARHNVGFMVLARLNTKRWAKSKSGLLQYAHQTIGNKKIEFIRPLTFMNRSGEAVSYVVKKHDIALDDVWVVHDDLDIALGSYKVQFGKGPRVHHGLQSIYDQLGSKEFWHVRVGIENRDTIKLISGKTYVLQRFSREEKVVIAKVIFEVASTLLERVVD